MLEAASKNPVTVDASLWSQICINVNISTELPSGAEKDTVLHETTQRQLFWDSVQGSACNSGSEKNKDYWGAPLCNMKNLCVKGDLSCNEHKTLSKIILKGQGN